VINAEAKGLYTAVDTPARGRHKDWDSGGGRDGRMLGGGSSGPPTVRGGGQGRCASCVCAGRRRFCARVCARTHPGRAPADSNSSACAVEMSTVCVLLLQVGKSPDTAWRALLATKVLSEAAPILEDYGLSCENDLSLLDQDDLMTLCSKLKQFPSKLLRKWVQGLADEQKAAADMNDAPAANTHSNSPPSEDEGEEEEHEEENGDEDEDSDEQGIQMWKTRRPTVVQRASKKVRGMGKLMKTCASSGRRARSIIRRMESEPRKA
jgi:hypothetical protein